MQKFLNLFIFNIFSLHNRSVRLQQNIALNLVVIKHWPHDVGPRAMMMVCEERSEMRAINNKNKNGKQQSITK